MCVHDFQGVESMLKNKHMRLDQTKIQKVRRILKARTETEALDKALDKVILEDRERLRRKRLMRRIMDLRKNLGRIEEDTALWVQLAREERTLSYDGRR